MASPSLLLNTTSVAMSMSFLSLWDVARCSTANSTFRAAARLNLRMYRPRTEDGTLTVCCNNTFSSQAQACGPRFRKVRLFFSTTCGDITREDLTSHFPNCTSLTLMGTPRERMKIDIGGLLDLTDLVLGSSIQLDSISSMPDSVTGLVLGEFDYLHAHHLPANLLYLRVWHCRSPLASSLKSLAKCAPNIATLVIEALTFKFPTSSEELPCELLLLRKLKTVNFGFHYNKKCESEMRHIKFVSGTVY